MHDGNGPSPTALTAAAARAAHLIVDGGPPIFVDEPAVALLGERAEELLAFHRTRGDHPVLAGARAQVTCRSRYAEERLAAAVRSGVGQHVVLGAGLDSFADRSPLAGRIRVLEVDHPATQEWKRERLADARIAVPPTVGFVPVDLREGDLLGSLTAHGLDPAERTFVSWLGVTMYLDRGAIAATLDTLGGLAPASELVADHILPAGMRDTEGDTYAALVGQAAAEQGEPWLGMLGPDEIGALLADHGFTAVGHVRQREAVPAGLWERSDGLHPIDLSMLVHATLG